MNNLVYYKDKNGKHPLKYISVYGDVFQFRKDSLGDIVLEQLISKTEHQC